MTAETMPRPPAVEISVSKQAVEGFVSGITQKAFALKQRISQKIDSVPVLKKAADRVRSFDARMQEKYGKTYKRARNITLGVGMAFVAAKAGTVGLTALCAVNAARCMAPMLSRAEKERQAGKATGILDYMGKHKTEALFSLAGATVSAGAAIAGISGAGVMMTASRAGGAALAATSDLTSVANSAAAAVKGEGSWKEVGDNLLAAGLTAGAFYLGSRGHEDSQPHAAQDTATQTSAQDIPAAAAPVQAVPVHDPVIDTPAPSPVPDTAPQIHADPVPAPEPVPEIVPQTTPASEPVPDAVPEVGADPVPGLEPQTDTPPVQDPLFDPKNYDNNTNVFVEKTVITDGRSTSVSINQDIDGQHSGDFRHEVQTLNGGSFTSTDINGEVTSTYTSPDGQTTDVSKDIGKAYRHVDANGDGEISHQETAAAENKLHNILSKKYGQETADQITEARAFTGKDVRVNSEAMNIARNAPVQPPSAAETKLASLLDSKGR